MAALAQDLIARKITSANHLAMRGGGGLDVVLNERTQGRHATPRQRKADHRAALLYTSLWRHLGGNAIAREHE